MVTSAGISANRPCPVASMNIAGRKAVPGEKWGMLGSETCNVEACSWGSRRSCGAQAWSCGEGACAVRLAAAVLRGGPRGALRDILLPSTPLKRSFTLFAEAER